MLPALAGLALARRQRRLKSRAALVLAAMVSFGAGFLVFGAVPGPSLLYGAGVVAGRRRRIAGVAMAMRLLAETEASLAPGEVRRIPFGGFGHQLAARRR